MKEYTITLNEADVKRIMRALRNREGHFRMKATEKGNEFAIFTGWRFWHS